MTTYWIGHYLYYRFRVPLFRPLLLFGYRLWDICIIRLFFNTYIPAEVQIGHGFTVPHGCCGIFMHKQVIIGDNVRIQQQVTIGRDWGEPGPTVIGDNVWIGAGAKILGQVRIGDGARIGANAVVVTDVPPGATAVGVPARILPPKEEAQYLKKGQRDPAHMPADACRQNRRD